MKNRVVLGEARGGRLVELPPCEDCGKPLGRPDHTWQRSPGLGYWRCIKVLKGL